MLVFCKGYPPKTFNPIKIISKTGGTVSKSKGQKNTNNSYRHTIERNMIKNKMKRLTNIWVINPQNLSGHPAPFPEKLAEDHILSWSNEGDTVLDPMCGSGTTLKMAKLNNRKFIGIEISEDYFKIAEARIKSINKPML